MMYPGSPIAGGATGGAPQPKQPLPKFNTPEGQAAILKARIDRDLGPAKDPMLDVMDKEIAKQPDMTLAKPDIGQPQTGGGMLQPDGGPLAPDLTGQVTKPTGPDRSTWDTDGYAGPAKFTQRSGAALGGYDPEKWKKDTHQTPKYAIGGILSQFDPTKGFTDDVLAAIQESYPNAKRIGNDKITYTDDPNEIPVDILNSADAGGRHWQWAPVESGGGGGVSTQSSSGDVLASLGGALVGGGQQQAIDSQIEEFLRAIMQGNAGASRGIGAR